MNSREDILASALCYGSERGGTPTCRFTTVVAVRSAVTFAPVSTMSGIVSTAKRTGIASTGKPTDRKTGVIGAINEAPLGNPTPPILMSTDIKPIVPI